MLDEEYVKQEMESGKYSGPLQELDTYSVLYEHFMNLLKKVDSRLHDVGCPPSLITSRCSNAIPPFSKTIFITVVYFPKENRRFQMHNDW